MSKDPANRRNLMREQLAHQAARLMAEDGITDYAFAKRKAARQMGATDTHNLPSNGEIEAALRSFRLLYQRESHPVILRQLREQALGIMRLLQPFHPYLTGSVLDGTAGENADINLSIYSDDQKAVIMFLFKHNLPFECGEWRTSLMGRQQTVPSITLETGPGAPVHIIVLPNNAQHSGSRKPGMHADEAALEKLLQNENGAAV